MCRVAVRQAPRQRPEEQLKQEPVSVLYGQLQTYQGVAEPSGLNVGLEDDDIDFENLFEDDDEPELESGELDLMALFSDDMVPAQQQAVPAYAATMPAVGAVQAAPAPQTVQQLQMQALMQQQQMAAQQPFDAAAPGAAVSQDMAQLQHYQATQMQAMLAAQAASMRQGQVVTKRGKTQAEVEEQQERIKKRRRESAQRSRARKNSYMKTLEVENKALKMENERLRMELMKLSHKAGSTSSSKPDTPSQHMVMSDHSAGELSVSEDMCHDRSGLSMPSAAHFFQLAGL